MIRSLTELAEIRAGHPFRGIVPKVADGNAYALQMRDIAADGSIAWPGVVRTQVEGRREPDWLRPGDIVFAARGLKNYAVCLGEVPLPTVCSQYFFHLRCRSADLLPEFLAWQINSAPCQQYFAKNAEGSLQLSIRRAVLEALPVAVPPLVEQQRIVALGQCAQAERKVFENLIQNRRRQLDAVAFQLFTDSFRAGNHQ